MGIGRVNSLEHALRKALEKGDANDPSFRRRVYEAAATAMQRSLTSRGEATPERVQDQTSRLEAAVRVIETDFRDAATPADPPVAPATDTAPQTPPQVDPPSEAPPEPDRPSPQASSPDDARVDPVLSETPAPTAAAPPVAPEKAPTEAGHELLYAEPRAEARDREAEELRAEQAPKVRRSPLRPDRGPFATVFAVVVAAALVFGGLWWVMTSGAFVSEEARDTSVRNPPLQLAEEDFTGRDPGTATAPQRAAQAQGDAEWIRLFEPSDPTVLRLEGGATASVESDPFGDYARLLTPGEEGRVYVDVPVGALQQLAGNRVQISLRARSDDGAPTQMSVTCDFGPLGDCGRRRFNVDQAETEFLFHVDLPDRSAAQEPGLLILRTDVEGGERAVNLLAARIRMAVQ